MDKETIEKDLFKLSNDIYSAEVELLDKTIDYQADCRKIDEIEAIIKSEVGLNLAFKNPEQRKGAIEIRLKEHDIYKNLQKTLPDKDKEVKMAQIGVNFLHNQLKIYLAIAGMVKI